MKRLVAGMLVLVAVAGCSSAPAPGEAPPGREPEKVQAIKFVPEEETPETSKKSR